MDARLTEPRVLVHALMQADLEKWETAELEMLYDALPKIQGRAVVEKAFRYAREAMELGRKQQQEVSDVAVSPEG